MFKNGLFIKKRCTSSATYVHSLRQQSPNFRNPSHLCKHCQNHRFLDRFRSLFQGFNHEKYCKIKMFRRYVTFRPASFDIPTNTLRFSAPIQRECTLIKAPVLDNCWTKWWWLYMFSKYCLFPVVYMIMQEISLSCDCN